ncbi:MAG: ACT domain-containing protein [Clostridia bacterium]|nr:ACT domain-containing protein [Clostridia bacterium]
MKAVVTVVGKDTKGIIAKVSTALFEADVNILDISQTIMQDLFTMIMLVDCGDSEYTISDINDKLQKTAEEMGMSIRVQREDIFSSMHKV